ncbi:NAD(P)H-binding protein [Cellulomonas sp. ICMP 17802]|uniref:NAD(P)H-binding protein n=1 Tax=Cellulomonas sp. ICMP 17802 TaxID=3239199 RepID=UPI00351B0BC9
MRIAIAGGHGQIARHLSRTLSARGDVPVALIRQLAHVDDVVQDGAEAVVLDLERSNARDVAEAIAGADAVVFAAGAGPGSGIARKDTVDRAAAALLADGAEQAGVRRYVLISSMGAGAPPPPGTDDVFAAYLVAKRAAELDVRARDLSWTVLRPGRLTDDAPTGAVHLDGSVPGGAVPRADVAAVLAALLHEPRSAGLVLELVGGSVPVDAAVAAVSTGPA